MENDSRIITKNILSKKEVDYKIYYKGKNYHYKEDPEGKNCPFSWKYVNNVKESDIINLNVLDNLKEINNIENFKYDKNRQKLILTSMESIVRYRVMITKRKYFDYSLEYHLDSDVPITYVPFHFEKSPISVKEKIKGNKAIAAVFISNCQSKERLIYIKELMNYVKIDSYGKCLHNKDERKEDKGKDQYETKLNIIRKYKFTLAFENSVDRDYVTEKFFQPLIEGSVPVYYGAQNIADFAPDKYSYIDVRKFKNPNELAKYLIYLDKNDKEYEKYLEWKKKAKEGDLGENLKRLMEIKKLNPICLLLQRINNIWINPFLTEWDRKDISKTERACLLC